MCEGSNRSQGSRWPKPVSCPSDGRRKKPVGKTGDGIPARPTARCGARALLARLHPALPAIIVFAAVMRVPGCFSDFWLDEIWTLSAASRLNSPIEIITRFRQDNNHHLNTLILYLVGEREHWVVYRIHSVVAGICTVVLAWFIARRAGALEAVIASLLTAGSYLLIHFSSEARGYALAVFFAFAGFLVARRFSETGRWLSAAVFWLCACLGFLSHLTYLHVFVGIAVWLPIRLLKTCEKKLDAAARYTRCFGVPIILLSCFYVVFIRHLVVGGGPEYDLIAILVKTLSCAGGGPAAGPIAVAAGAATAGLFLWGIGWLWQKEPRVARGPQPDRVSEAPRAGRKRETALGLRSEGIFHLIVVFFSPAAVLALRRPEVLFVRYFLISIAFGYIAASYVLAHLWRRGYPARICAGGVLLLFLVGNGINAASFFRYGHGGYLEGLRHMAAHTPGQVITMAGEHDFQTRTLVEYYQRYLPAGKEVVYFSRREYPAQGPTWLISDRFGDPGEVLATILDRHGNAYKLSKTLPYSGILSGWHWFIYQKQEPADAGPLKRKPP